MKENFRFYWEEPFDKKDPQIKIDAPGFSKEEIKVRLTEDSITVSAAKNGKREEKGKDFYRAEAFASSFSKSMTFPHKINPKDYEIETRDGSVILKRKKKKEIKV